MTTNAITISRKLQAAGMERNIAEAVAEAITQAIAQAIAVHFNKHLATKADVADIRADISCLESNLTAEIARKRRA